MARVRENNGKEEEEKKKRKIAANVLIVRKTFGFKSWQQFSMQRGKIRNSQFLRVPLVYKSFSTPGIGLGRESFCPVIFVIKINNRHAAKLSS